MINLLSFSGIYKYNYIQVHVVPYSGKFSNGANFSIIRKHSVCAKIKTFEILFSAHVGVA